MQATPAAEPCYLLGHPGNQHGLSHLNPQPSKMLNSTTPYTRRNSLPGYVHSKNGDQTSLVPPFSSSRITKHSKTSIHKRTCPDDKLDGWSSSLSSTLILCTYRVTGIQSQTPCHAAHRIQALKRKRTPYNLILHH